LEGVDKETVVGLAPSFSSVAQATNPKIDKQAA
jgi:hypothetical protein